MERVTALEGDQPLLVIAPHGFDDHNTDYITERIANELDAYAVINRGWLRAIKTDYIESKANCNDIRQLHEDVVREEFLEPILRFQARTIRDYGFCYIFIIHGMGDYVRIQANDPLLDLVIGYGAGNPPFHSCEPAVKDAFVYYCEKHGFGTYQGAAGGAFAGKDKNNLNQLFRRWYPDTRVQSMQVEIIREFRDDLTVAKLTAETLASCIDDLLDGSYMSEAGGILIKSKSI